MNWGWLAVPFWAVLYWVWHQSGTHYDAPPLWAMLVGLIALAVLGRRVTWPVWLWWAAGLATLAWSLTPGSTLVLGLWELLYVAAFAAAASSSQTWLWAFWALNLALLADGLYSAFSLSAFGMAMLFSGSIHYVMGAQALVLVPMALGWLRRSGRWAWLSGVLLIVAVFAALSSGARAVYVPLVIALALGAWRLWREGIGLVRLAVGSAALIVTVVVLDTVLPFHPVREALGGKVSLSKQASDFNAEGSFTSRLQMWDQTLSIAVSHPLGTGTGSFRDTLPAFMKYPTVLFANAHNYYLETAATGGWLRLLLLVGLLGSSLWRAWRSRRWPLALGAFGLWATLAFDITGYYPGVMMLAFATLGALEVKPEGIEIFKPAPRRPPVLAWGLSAVGMLLVLWWFLPCQGAFCSLERQLGWRTGVLDDAQLATPIERRTLFEGARGLNPKSFWVDVARLRVASGDAERLWILEDITRRFPLQGPGNYLELARTALRLGRREQARRVLELGLQRFPPTLLAAGVPLQDTTLLARWVKDAQTMLRELR
jgi:O-antigen ligase